MCGATKGGTALPVEMRNAAFRRRQRLCAATPRHGAACCTVLHPFASKGMPKQQAYPCTCTWRQQQQAMMEVSNRASGQQPCSPAAAAQRIPVRTELPHQQSHSQHHVAGRMLEHVVRHCSTGTGLHWMQSPGLGLGRASQQQRVADHEAPPPACCHAVRRASPL